MTQTFTLVFLCALIASLVLKLWLATRQTRHIVIHRDAVPMAFADTITLEEHRRAADYSVARLRLSMLSAACDTLIVSVFTLGGGLQALASLIDGQVAGELARGVLLIGLTVAISSALSLPFTLYATFGIEARFGFNQMRWRLFLLDTLRGAALTVVLGVPLLTLVLWLMRVSGAGWWLWVWLVWTGVSLLMLAIYPTLIAPLFNRFSPLTDETLKRRIESLLTRCGFKSQGVFMMDGSTRSSHGNAYFTGFGAAKRIVFFDTLLTRLDGDEIEAVLAHELGHFRKKHIRKRMLFTFGLSLLLLYGLGLLLDAPWFYQGLGLAERSNAIALILFFMAMPAFAFPLTPVSSWMSRKHEYEADDFAASETRPEWLISALVKLYRDNAATLTPDPIHSAFYDSHPPAALRIAHLKGERP
ncbi:M48 family metallopeptidase [Paludibacterium yongneupense]|uniref:M48 family metallopeptidase n=1 Tax=Paludibacterium yongneupense TaxID=400061 RepID=UPI00042689E3|nr:M48 family metallopeptidase [Paludibacterium yongneupense]